MRNDWTSEKYLALIVLPQPFPLNELRAAPQTCKRSQELIHTLLKNQWTSKKYLVLFVPRSNHSAQEK
jgi:hypothetical protein